MFGELFLEVEVDPFYDQTNQLLNANLLAND